MTNPFERTLLTYTHLPIHKNKLFLSFKALLYTKGHLNFLAYNSTSKDCDLVDLG